MTSAFTADCSTGRTEGADILEDLNEVVVEIGEQSIKLGP